LIYNADRLSKKLAEEKARKEKEEIMNRLTRKKLEYPHHQTYKRQNSYKGRLRKYLVPPDEQEEFKR